MNNTLSSITIHLADSILQAIIGGIVTYVLAAIGWGVHVQIKIAKIFSWLKSHDDRLTNGDTKFSQVMLELQKTHDLTIEVKAQVEANGKLQEEMLRSIRELREMRQK